MEQKSKRKFGNEGEEIAVNYLIENGYNIRKKNFKFGNVGEIDIIAEDGDYLCFIEVKTRTNLNYGHPLESITPSKIKAARKAAEGYIHINKLYNRDCRFDAIAIEINLGVTKIELFKNIF